MSNLLVFEYQQYKNLELFESMAISSFIDENDKGPISELIRSGRELTPGMRDFIADMLLDKVKRSKKPSTFSRDYELYKRIEELRLSGRRPIRSNARQLGAAAIAAEEFGLNGKDPEEAAINAHDRIRKAIEEDRKITHEELYGESS